MTYKTPLITGRFLRRYKRFFADVELNGQTVVAHVPNTGSLKGICDQERPCRLSRADDPNRKLQFTLEQVQVGDAWVGVNTHKANTLAREVLEQKLLPHWADLLDVTAEVKLNKETRFDFGLHRSDGKTHFVEVKSVTMKDGVWAQFPDAETTRGQKHLIELTRLAQEKSTVAELLFVVQRNDCSKFRAADAIDPEYARLLEIAKKSGVIVNVLAFELTDAAIVFSREIDGHSD